MILIADSGSTKTDWALTGGVLPEPLRFHTQGINLFHQRAAQVVSILQEELLPQITAAQVAAEEVAGVFFYGAGCTSSVASQMAALLSEVFPKAEVSADSDLLGAARAVLGRNAGIACILGTGANSCLYDGARITHHVPPLGYILGDEGSGAVLGRRFLNGIFKGWLPASVKDAFLAETQQTYEDIIRRVYQEPMANRYLASIAPFIVRHIDDAGIRQLVADNFEDFFRYNILRYDTTLRNMACVGGVVAHLETVFREVAARHQFTVTRIIKSPIEGLVDYHRA